MTEEGQRNVLDFCQEWHVILNFKMHEFHKMQCYFIHTKDGLYCNPYFDQWACPSLSVG